MNQKETILINNEKGSAIVETLPLLIIFMTILGNMWGFFMATHSGILSSIAARTYAFETFRNRSDLTYFRDQATHSGEAYDTKINYHKVGTRIHSIVKLISNEKFQASTVDYNQFSPSQAKADASVGDQHNHKQMFENTRRRKGVQKIWIRSNYGICITFNGCA